MKFNIAKISSLNGRFESYEIKHIIGITYAQNEIMLTYIDKTDNTIQMNKYSSNDIIINIV